MHSTRRITVLAAAGLLALSGCSGTPGGTDPGGDPELADETTADPADCFTGGPWELDLADYASQAEPWMVGLGIPISDFAMTGSQTVQFTADGLVSVVTDITSTGTLHTPAGDIPVSVPSTLGGSGDWALDSGASMTITNWAADTPVTESDDAFDPPVLDFSTIPTVGVTCQPGLLTLTAPESPFVPLFRR